MKTIIAAILALVLMVSCSPQPNQAVIQKEITKTQTIFITDTAIPTELLSTETSSPTNTIQPTLNPTFTSSPNSIKTVEYVLLNGDTCVSISLKFKTDIETLKRINPGLRGKANCELANLTKILVPQTDSTAIPTLIKIQPTLPIQPTQPPVIVQPTKPPTAAPPPPTTAPVYPTQPPAAACCKHCANSIPCGDTCIASNKTCHTPPGCACK
jgi:hypothetical protein